VALRKGNEIFVHFPQRHEATPLKLARGKCCKLALPQRGGRSTLHVAALYARKAHVFATVLILWSAFIHSFCLYYGARQNANEITIDGNTFA